MTAQTAIYVRISTAKQDLDGQLKQCSEYCTENLGIDESDLDVYRDTSSGADLDRSGFREMMSDVKNGEVERIVVKEISRISRDMRDLNETVGTVCDDNDAALHILDSGLRINTDEDEGLFDDRLMMQVLGISAELERKMTIERTRAGIEAAQEAGKQVGRPPYGFTTDSEGYLVRGDDFDTARTIIRMVYEDDESKRQTSRHTGVARSTISNIVDNRHLYFPDRYDEPESEEQN